MRVAIWMTVVAAAACTRAVTNDQAHEDASPIASSVIEPSAAPVTSARARSEFRSPPAEARRARYEKPLDAKELAPYAKALADHFGAAAREPLLLQSTEIENDRRALFFASEKPAPDSMPLILAVDDHDAILWKKERPVAGIVKPVGDVTITPGPESGVAIFFYDPPTKIVAARMWDRDGGVFADFQLMTMDACDAVSAAYWPKLGWVVVASEKGVARAQLLRHNGGVAWGEYGITMGTPSRNIAPASIVIDTEDSVMFFQRGILGGSVDAGVAAKKPDEHLLVSRYDANGVALWNHPIDLGPLPNAPNSPSVDRIVATRVHSGAAVVLGPHPIDVMSDGKFERH